MSDNRSSMKIWMMAAAAIVVVGGGLIGLIWYLMSGRTTSNGIVVPQLTVEKIPSLIEDIKSQNGQSLNGLSTIISLFDSNKKIEGKETPEKNAEDFLTKNPEIAFKIRQALDYNYVVEASTLTLVSTRLSNDNFFDFSTEDALKMTEIIKKSGDRLPSKFSVDFLKNLCRNPGHGDFTLFMKAVILNNGWRKDFVRFFNQHLDKEHRLDIEKYCPWLTSEEKFFDNLNSFLVLIERQTSSMECLNNGIMNISLKAYALEGKKTVDIKKPDDITNTEFEKYLNDLESKKSELEALDGEIVELGTKYSLLVGELNAIEASKKDDVEKKQQDVYDSAQEQAIKSGSEYLIFAQHWLDMEKFAWWSFISSKVMIAAPRATVSVLQKILPGITELSKSDKPDKSIKSGDDLTEDLCAELIVCNYKNLGESLKTKEEKVKGDDKKSAENKDKKSAEKKDETKSAEKKAKKD